MTKLTNIEMLIKGLESVGGWQHDVIEESGLTIEELEIMFDHHGDLDDTCNAINDGEYRKYDGVWNMGDVARQLEDDGCLDIQHHVKDGYYFDYKQLEHDMYCGGDWSEMAWNEASEMVEDNGSHSQLSTELFERVEAFIEDSNTEDKNILIDDVHCYILDELYDGEYRQSFMEELVENSDNELLSRYFDYDAFGRDLEIEGNFYQTKEGIFEII